jgi:hypothetical protein
MTAPSPNPAPPAPNPAPNGPPADPANPPAPAPTPSPTPTGPATDPKPDDKPDTDARLAAMEEQLKTTGAERDSLKGILAKLGEVLNPDAKKNDPAELAKVLADREKALADTQMELAVLKIAGEKGNDLLDSRKFLESIKGLEVGSDAFNAKVKEAADAKPDSGGKKGKSGGAELNGGSPATKGQLTREDLKGMSPEEIVTAESEGRLTSLLSGKG